MHQLSGKRREALRLTISPAPLDRQVVTVDVPERAQPFAEDTPGTPRARCGTRENTYPRNQSGLLRLDDGRREHDKDEGEAASQGRPPVRQASTYASALSRG
jgi:hypothetical protein